MMDNVWQYVTQLFGHIMSPKLLNMAYCTYGLNQFKQKQNYIFLGLSYGLGISSKMTKCAISTFVTKYSFYGILYPYSVRHIIRTIQPIFMKCWQELKQIINLVLDVFLLIANSKHARTDSQRKEISFKRQDSCHFIPIFSRMYITS